MRSCTKRSAAATVVKNVASVAARLFSDAAVNGVRMLIDASIMHADAPARKRHLAADERGERIGERQEEERQAEQEQDERRVHASRRPGERRIEPRTAGRTRPRGGAPLRSIALTITSTTARPTRATSASRASVRCQNCRSASRSACQSARFCRRSAKRRANVLTPDVPPWKPPCGVKAAATRGAACAAAGSTALADESAESSAEPISLQRGPILGGGERGQRVRERLELDAPRGRGAFRQPRQLLTQIVRGHRARQRETAPPAGDQRVEQARAGRDDLTAFAVGIADDLRLAHGAADERRGRDARRRQRAIDQRVVPAPLALAGHAASSRSALKAIRHGGSTRSPAVLRRRAPRASANSDDDRHQRAERDEGRPRRSRTRPPATPSDSTRAEARAGRVADIGRIRPGTIDSTRIDCGGSR